MHQPWTLSSNPQVAVQVARMSNYVMVMNPMVYPLHLPTGEQMAAACEPLREEESDEKQAVVPDHPEDDGSRRDLRTVPSSNSLARWAIEGGERSSQQVCWLPGYGVFIFFFAPRFCQSKSLTMETYSTAFSQIR